MRIKPPTSSEAADCPCRSALREWLRWFKGICMCLLGIACPAFSGRLRAFSVEIQRGSVLLNLLRSRRLPKGDGQSEWPEFCHYLSWSRHDWLWPFMALAAQNRESRIARFPASRSDSQIPQQEAKNESNRNKVEPRKIDSESTSESQPTNAQSDLGIAGFESHDSESPDSRFRIADSVPLSLWQFINVPQKGVGTRG